MKKKISTGLVALIKVSMEGRCGGAVVNEAKNNKVVNLANMKKKMTTNLTKLAEIRTLINLKTKNVPAAKKKAIKLNSVQEILI